jgi:sugar diacid utilization regulator
MQIIDSIIQGNSLDDIICITEPLFKNPFYIMDDSLKIIASVKDADFEEMSVIWRFQSQNHYWPMEQMISMLHTNDLAKLKTSHHAQIFLPGDFNMPCCGIRIQHHKITYGYIFIVGLYHRLNQCDIELLERLSSMIISRFVNSNSQRELHSGMYYEQIFRDIVDQKFVDRSFELKQQLSFINWQNDTLFQVITLDLQTDDNSEQLFLLINIFNNELKGKLFCLNNQIHCIFSLREAPEFQREILYYLKKMSMHCGISERFSDIENLSFYLNQSEIALKYGLHANTQAWLYHYEDFYPLHIGSVLKNALQDQGLWSNEIETLSQYDRLHQTDYVKTIFLYLQCERNIVQTARELHIHRNSLVYRLNKINDLVYLDLDNPSVRMRILLEIYALQASSEI